MGFGCHLSCHWWQPIFFKGLQCGTINLSGVMHCTRSEEELLRGEEKGGRKRKGVEEERRGAEWVVRQAEGKRAEWWHKKTNAARLTRGETEWCKVDPTPEMTCCRWLTMNRRSSKPLSRNLLSYCGSPTCSSQSPTGWSSSRLAAPADRGKRFRREKPFSR